MIIYVARYNTLVIEDSNQLSILLISLYTYFGHFNEIYDYHKRLFSYFIIV